MLSVASSWFRRGAGHQFRIPTRWGSAGRLNLIGTWSLSRDTAGLQVRELSGSCTGEQVVAYLDTLAQSCDPTRLTVVILDNAPFHKGALVRDRRKEWERQGLYLRYLPSYTPFLNHIEMVWKRLKGFLMPRRCYGSLAELRDAMIAALKIIGATFI